jgi:2-succinyl-5-enolpyruvyl-6-hydroxy-3-cyclohexene-1-carboxylate synthase
MGNVERAARVVADVRAAGVREFCVCAGSRNAALLAVLGATGERLFSFVDERSAAFFAIGRMKSHGDPVAVVTTSGTAVAELLAATIEAYYAGLPLVLITADRPARFRGTGAPQAIEQVGIFGAYADRSLEEWSGDCPLHLNVEFEDEQLECGSVELPLSLARQNRKRAGYDPATQTKAAALPPHSKPLVIVGALAPRHRDRVRSFVSRLNAPTFAEPLSGLREDADLPLITSGERMIGRATFDGVLRIGNVPTLRYWRDLETNGLPVVHFSDLPFAGLTRGDVHPIESLPELEGTRDEKFFAEDREHAARFEAILAEEPDSELAMVRKLSLDLAPASRVYLGNSLPVREWDLAATREARGFVYEANRGANGIDGQLSTFFGWCEATADNVCVVGDLTAIYDLNAPWIVAQLGGLRIRVVVVNNGGGRIFSRVPSLRDLDASLRERIIENAHGIRFQHWAAMWDLNVTELRPDAEASKRVWQRYDELWT